MSSNKDLKHLINYYCREKYYQTAETFASEGIKQYPDDISFKLYSCFSLVLSGRHQESIRELEILMKNKDMNIGAVLALITAYKGFQPPDKDSILHLENKLKAERKKATDLALYYGSLFLYFSDKINKSIDYLEKTLKNNANFVEGLILKGWLEISSNKTSNYKLANNCFNTTLQIEKQNLDAFLGLIKVKEKENDFTGVVTLLNQLIVKFPNILPPLIEKMKIQLVYNDWDVAIELANRILNNSGNCIEAFKIKTLTLLAKDGNCDEAVNCLKQLCHEIEKSEKKNGLIYFENAQLFSYLSGKNSKILKETYNLAEKAALLEPSNPCFLTELGYQSLLQGNIKEATKFFKSSTKLDDSSISALTGLIMCQIEEEGMSEQIRQQVEFLREIQSDQPSSELLLMSAKLTNSSSEAFGFLNQAIKIHFDNFKKYPFGITYLYHLNPVFLMQMVYEFMKHIPSTYCEKSWGKKIPEPLSKSKMILEELTNSCPGLIEAQYAYAYTEFLVGNLKKAKEIVTHILEDLDTTLLEAHTLLAEIYFLEKNYQEGAHCLEVGLSYNFSIQEKPIYHIMAAMVHKKNGNQVNCINSLKSAMAASKLKNITKTDIELIESMILRNNKIVIYLELIEAYLQNNQSNEAIKLIKCALEDFKGTSEENRIMIANAEILIQQEKFAEGIFELNKIQPNQSYYTLAKTVMAKAYLDKKKDREMFAECYKNLVENHPSAETYSMLGDAYMTIQEANLAIEAYQEALKTNPKDVNLISKLGKALIKTHYFLKAINYYKEAVKNDENLILIYDLAELYFKLGEFDNAERVLVNELEKDRNESSELNYLICKTKLLQLLAKVRDKNGNLTESLEALKASKENYHLLSKKLSTQSSELKEILYNICLDMATLLTRLRDFNGAIKSYKESLVVKSGDPKILVALSKLYMQKNDFEECELTSKRLLAADPNNESAAIILADLAFKKIDFEAAAFHFKQLLTKKPTFWAALARLIEVMRRTGSLDEVIPFLENAENHSQISQEAGYFYCKGLFDRYSEKPASALRHFNQAKRHGEWGQKALFHMIEICLNPENETLRSETFTDEIDKEDLEDSREMALKMAKRLLEELNSYPGSHETFAHRLLENFWLLATNQKSNIEKAQQDFAFMAAQDLYKDNIAITLGLSSAYVLQKQIQKAKNHLKKMSKNEWNHEDAEYLERGWLLLTDIYIQAGKLDTPVDLIQRILQYNKSCYKAYDYAGIIAEKEQLYRDAAFQYEKAWRYCGQTNPAIGYKLAFNYLKGKKYAGAIEVCCTILKSYPDYPRIQKEILEKAKTNLRT